jgi:Domain of unknown function (DUF4234)
MAETVSIGAGDTAKIRNPWAVAGLVFVFLAIPFIYWLSFAFSASGSTGEAWALLVISLATFPLGIYGIFWFYSIKRELRDLGIARSDERLARLRPGMSVVLMVLLGWTFIVPMVLVVLLMRQIVHAQEIAGVERSSMPLMVALLVAGVFFVAFILPLAVFCGVLRGALNRIWCGLPAGTTPAVSPV